MPAASIINEDAYDQGLLTFRSAISGIRPGAENTRLPASGHKKRRSALTTPAATFSILFPLSTLVFIFISSNAPP